MDTKPEVPLIWTPDLVHSGMKLCLSKTRHRYLTTYIAEEGPAHAALPNVITQLKGERGGVRRDSELSPREPCTGQTLHQWLYYDHTTPRDTPIDGNLS